MKIFDTVIIGAGQAGLCAAKHAKELGLSYVVLDKQGIGQVWQARLKGMKLFTSRQFCGLPELKFSGVQNGFPAVTEMAQYLQDYVKTFDLDVRQFTPVRLLSKEQGLYQIELEAGEMLRAKTVINATGSNQQPIIPSLSSGLSDEVVQHTSVLTSLDEVPSKKRVVIVGDGATGRQIAGGLASRCQVILATGRPRGFPKNKVLGKDIFWWLNLLGILRADSQSLVAKFIQRRNPVPCGGFNNARLKKLGVRILGRAINCSGREMDFNNGSVSDMDIVIWSVGYAERVD